MEPPVIVAQLGSGGMADVFLAMRRGMGGFVKLVVVKRLRTAAMEGDAVAMFHDEARISARLNHPNVVQTHEAGFDGEHYRLEMEYLDGQPLHRVLSRARKAGRTVSHGTAVAIVRDVLAGLHYAHTLRDYDGSPLGIVHRDVSPQNIFVTYDGRVKLVDFGIAKAAGQVSVTQLGSVKGKIRYMAPEQALLGRAVDHRADVFAAGVVLWQLLVGRSYWGDVDDVAIFQMLTTGDLPPSPRVINPAVAPALDHICARALSFDPAARYATAEEFGDALATQTQLERGAERMLGKMAADLFADVRQAVKTEIEKAAARPPAQPGDDEPPTKLIVMSQSSPSVSALTASGSHPIVQVSERPVTQAVRPRARRPQKRRASVPLLGILVGVLGATLVLLLFVFPPKQTHDTRPPSQGTSTGPVGSDTAGPARVTPPSKPADGADQSSTVDRSVSPGASARGRGRGPIRAGSGGEGREARPGGPANTAEARPVDAGPPPEPARTTGRPPLLQEDMWDAGSRP